MKMGVKEFRERFSEVALSEEPIVVTHHGKVLGTFNPGPVQPRSAIDWATLETKLAAARKAWKSKTPDWSARMENAGFNVEGELARK